MARKRDRRHDCTLFHAVCGLLFQFIDKRKIFGCKGVSACAEEVESLAVLKENGFLRFVNDKLRARNEIVYMMAVYDNTVIALKS